MIYSKEAENFSDSLVSNYTTYNIKTKFYELEINQIPEFDVHEFSSILLKDEDLANEANGCDNPHFETRMLPALISTMKNSVSRDEEIEFKNAWREGISEYLRSHMQKLISESLIKYNHDMGCYENDNPGYSRGDYSENRNQSYGTYGE